MTNFQATMRHLTSLFLLASFCSLSVAQSDCPNPYDGNGDGAVTINDLLDLLGLFGDVDTDLDGIWDSVDDCADTSACNYAAEPTAPCAFIDVLGDCGGGCEGDGDGDGICDDEDDCVGNLDECGVCNGPGPTEVVIEDITILYDSVYLPQLEEWYVYAFGADTTFSYECASIISDSPYTTDIISQPYEPLTGYSLVNLFAGWDDPEEMLPIPFDMVMWGDTCTMVMTANLGEMILATGNAYHFVAPVFADICDVSPADPTGQDISEIRHKIDGISPNRIFRVEYHNVGFYLEVYGGESVVTATQRANYQVWLHETGTITFHYGPNTITDHSLIASAFVNSAGLVGNYDPDSSTGSFLVAEGAADGPQFQTFNDIFDPINSGDEGWGNTWPSEGTGYVFTPILPAVSQ